MRQKQSLLISNSGFTILEMMVACCVGLLVLGLAFSSIFAARKAALFDFERTRLNQQMRGAFDIIAANIRQAGENLPSGFPAIELVNGGTTVPDQLILRRNLLDEVLTVCQTINAGSTSNLYFATTPIDPLNPRAGCVPTDPGTTARYNTWHAYRLEQGGSTRAFIYDFGTRLSEFFTFSNDAISSTDARLIRVGSWANQYTIPAEPAGSTAAAYIIEEFQFRVADTAPNANVLQIVSNEDYGAVDNIAPDVKNFQVTITMTDGTVKNSFARTDSWKLVKYLDVTLTGETQSASRTISASLTGRFLPRNVFSK